MTIRCWSCKQPARLIYWSKAAGYFAPTCGLCPVPDPAVPGETVFLTSNTSEGKQ